MYVPRYGAGRDHQPQHWKSLGRAAAHGEELKKPGLDQWRPCGDYQALNTWTITDSYITPNLHSLNFQLKGKCVFSRLDLVKGFFQVLVNKASRAKTADVTPFGTFQFNFMLFGLKNAGETIKR